MAESFTTSDQVARDMAMGKFPGMSDRTKHELAERERIYGVVIKCFKASGIHTKNSVARSIAIELVPTAPVPAPEHNGGDVW